MDETYQPEDEPQEQPQTREVAFRYDHDIYELPGAPPFDEGKLKGFLHEVLIPNSSILARRIIREHPGLDITRRPDGMFEVTTSYIGIYVGAFDLSAVYP